MLIKTANIAQTEAGGTNSHETICGSDLLPFCDVLFNLVAVILFGLFDVKSCTFFQLSRIHGHLSLELRHVAFRHIVFLLSQSKNNRIVEAAANLIGGR